MAAATGGTARLEQPVLPKCLTRFNIDWTVDGKPATLQSRAIDDTGYVQPRSRSARAVRGTRSIYHNNAIQSWRVARSGEVGTCTLGIAAVHCAVACDLARVAGIACRAGGRPLRRHRPRGRRQPRSQAWDIDVRRISPGCRRAPDRSSAAGHLGAKCASCHGVFGESNEVLQSDHRRHDAEDVKTVTSSR
jgi:hypothetical protein